MYNYFENLSLFNLLNILFKQSSPVEEYTSQDYFYFDITRIASLLIPRILTFTNIKITRLDFEMTQIRDKNNELQRLRIYREDIEGILEEIERSKDFKIFNRDQQLPGRLPSYILKGLVDGEISVKGSINRSLFIIKVVVWHLNLINKKYANLTLENRTWVLILKDIALKDNINLIVKQNFFTVTYNRLKVFLSLSYYPKLYLFLKNLKYFSINGSNRKNLKQTIYVEGRRDLHFKNDGNNSDFFWEMNSSFKKKRIIYPYQTAEQKKVLTKYGIKPISGNAGFSSILSDSKIKMKKRPYSLAKDEYSEINHLINTYSSNLLFWQSLFKKHNTKVYFSWYKFDKSHMVAADAIQSIGGISVLWQVALNAIQETMCKTDIDVLFSYSKHCANIDKKIHSNFRYNIISGYPKDYAINKCMADAIKLKNTLRLNGAKNIVSVLDENSLDDSRWHTGHQYQKDNYTYILKNLLKNEDMGVIFKPKRYINLRKRLGEEIWCLLERAIKTGRCYLFDETKGHTTLATPVVACLASDLCIHSHLCAGSAGLESALAGVPTILIDREYTPASLLNDLPRDSVVFSNWEDTIEGVNNYFSENLKDKKFGNWSPILEDLDPFQDGLGAKRMGDFLESLFHGFEKGIDREEVMTRAVEKYADKWGSDKIIIN